MEPILDLLRSLHGDRLEALIHTGGFALLVAIVFAETGLLAGFFLPGDSLLFLAGASVGAGLLKAPGALGDSSSLTSLLVLMGLLIVAAVAGDTTGYWFGKKVGSPLFDRENSRFFKKEHLVKTQAFYERHGGKTIILARWMPFARTFAPVVAGVAGMPYRQFMTYNVVGGVTWVISMTLLGYTLGTVEFVRKHNEKVIVGIVLLSVLPIFLHAWKERRAARGGVGGE